MTRMIELSSPGGVENLRVSSHDPGDPRPDEIRLRQTGAGVNFIDIYQRKGLYPLPMPAVLGVEGAGIVEAIGDGVSHLRVGDRVGYAGIVGGYAEVRLLPAWRAVKLPSDIPDDLAASSLLRASTAHMLLHKVHAVSDGTSILIHAGAGGLASIVIPWARRLGARIIATASTEAKAEEAKAHGAERVIIGRNAAIARDVREWTEGRGVDLTIDGIGEPTFRESLEATAQFGTLASVGQAGGALASLSVADLTPQRSIGFHVPSVMAYLADRFRYEKVANETIAALRAGPRRQAGPQFALSDARAAQASLENGATTGTPLLVI
ncbi:quinone oxidoreductase family protein [Salipiger thiooxidans]|uniref:quinone oxidoreductase family protein n=1 Tax=Salipiger thiooxidans TaxID=282683 RepID=UPI001CD2C702|nr:quinone oxidoreductase [Salipiger thiooxidans]MCA0851443.1 quinone oxidoreductase [Salipiger thiooxidans]